ncbi:ABC transporter substrate-binding protein [Labrys wisconsinensis]|uniref:Peptide/nickel transport system substrate-binding protein n=1 Tax=Labrys wisconsinensis TaxID=425677 RepID=A0ABU0JEG3_9HYPH|nr:ABC transporter substrate-binding protein [Labrys wisconsinensis]MDQ0472659.1 peptide/nickel transport system substrate-binding protein [Labrys wisconsinensis]
MADFSVTRRQAVIGGLAGGLLGAAGVRAAPARESQRLTVAMSGFPPAVEPALFNHTATRRVVPQMFDTLIAFDQTAGMGLRPALAERWQRLDDRSLRLFLRRGVTFHDGSPFTAEDVAFSLGPDHVLGPKRSGQATAIQTLDTIDRAEIVDDHTVVVHAKANDALLEQRLASWGAEIVGSRAFQAAGSWDKWTAAPVGTGPYRIVGQRLDIDVTLAAHDGYWGGRPAFRSIEYRIVPELASRINALVTGEVDLITDLPPDQFADIAGRPGLEVVGGAVQNIRSLGIDQTAPVFRDPRLRRALSLALDRKLFVDALWDGRVPVPNGFQLPSFGAGYIEDYPALAYDPELARQLVRESGYGGEPITYRLLNNYYTNQVSGAQTMLEMWRSVGLDVRIEMVENWTQIYRKPVNAIYDNSCTAIFPDHLGQAWRVFGPNGEMPRQNGIWKNDEYFGLGTRLKESTDVAERRRILRRMLEIIDRDDPPCVILHVSGQFYGKRRDLPWVPGQTLDLNFGPSNQAFAQN